MFLIFTLVRKVCLSSFWALRQNWVGDQGKQLPTSAQEPEPKGKAGCGGAGMWFPCPCREGACCSLPRKNHWRFSTISSLPSAPAAWFSPACPPLHCVKTAGTNHPLWLREKSGLLFMSLSNLPQLGFSITWIPTNPFSGAARMHNWSRFSAALPDSGHLQQQ